MGEQDARGKRLEAWGREAFAWLREQGEARAGALVVRNGATWWVAFPHWRPLDCAQSLSEEVACQRAWKAIPLPPTEALPYGECGLWPSEEWSRAREWVAIPLSIEEEVEAVVHLLREKPLEQEPTLPSLLQPWLSSLAWMVRAWQAQEREARRRLELEALQEILMAMRSVADPEVTLGEVVSSLGMILEGEKCVVLLVDGERKALVPQPPALGLTDSEREALSLPLDHPLAKALLEKGEMVFLGEGREEPSWPLGEDAVLRRWQEEGGVRGGWLAPLIMEGRALGAVGVFNKRGGVPFTEEDQTLLALLAGQAASILHIARLHASVQEEQAKLWAVIRSLANPAIVLDKEQRILLVNQQAERLLGIQGGEVQGIPVEQAIQREDVVRLIVNPPERRPGEPPPEISVGEKPYPRFYQVRMAEVKDEEGRSIGRVVVFNDVTELKRVDQMKSEFVSAVSHELRTPLTSIKAFTSTLLREDVQFDPETQREWLSIINSQTDRLTRLINDLLSLSRIERGLALQMNYSLVDLRRLIEEVLESQRAYSSRHTLRAQVDSNLALIEADEDKVVQILTNLVNNAIKYSPRGGEVRVVARDEGEHVLVSVQDQGPGIPPEHLDRIFDKFYQVDSSTTRRVGGTGLGLYLTRHLVEAHGGRIWVESQVGEGSTFFFTLPKRRPG